MFLHRFYILSLIAFQLVCVFEYNNEINFVANYIINNYLKYVAFLSSKTKLVNK